MIDLIYGPPCAGKSTLREKLAGVECRPIFDTDEILNFAISAGERNLTLLMIVRVLERCAPDAILFTNLHSEEITSGLVRLHYIMETPETFKERWMHREDAPAEEADDLVIKWHIGELVSFGSYLQASCHYYDAEDPNLIDKIIKGLQ